MKLHPQFVSYVHKQIYRRTRQTAVKTVSAKTSDRSNNNNIECGPIPNVMAVLPNIGGALCSTPQNLANAHYLSAVQ